MLLRSYRVTAKFSLNFTILTIYYKTVINIPKTATSHFFQIPDVVRVNLVVNVLAGVHVEACVEERAITQRFFGVGLKFV